MWIKEPINPLGRSGRDIVNFLFQKDNIYISDNHLSAAWCWLNEVDIRKTYNLLHIDRHYDLLHRKNLVNEEIVANGIDLKALDFSTYQGLSYRIRGSDRDTKVFSFDNYICNLHIIYPELFSRNMHFATHNDGTIPEELREYIQYEIQPWNLFNNIKYYLESNGGEYDWIVNLDIDYFFTDENGEYFQFLTDEYINRILDEIKSSLKRIKVFTIALSPEFCGWENTLRVLTLIDAKFDLKIPFDKLNLIKP